MISENEVIERLDRIESLLRDQKVVKDFYSLEEFAERTKRAVFTCQEWCRRGRVKGIKKRSGRGKFSSWAISHEELQRYEREGLLPGR